MQIVIITFNIAMGSCLLYDRQSIFCNKKRVLGLKNSYLGLVISEGCVLSKIVYFFGFERFVLKTKRGFSMIN